MDLSGRHVVVTGGSRGLGAAIGKAFVDAGAAVTLVARTREILERTASEIGAHVVAADLRSPDGVIEQAAQHGPIDVLVNNAGVDEVGDFEQLTSQALHDVYAVNAVAPAELARQVLPAMRQRGSGRLVFISSMSAQVAMPGLTAYSATKAATSQLAEGLRIDLHGTGIGVTLAEIGPVSTDMYESVKTYPPCADAFARMIKLGFLRMLSPEEVADAVVSACRKDRDSVVLPRRGRTQVSMWHLPQRIANRVL